MKSFFEKCLQILLPARMYVQITEVAERWFWTRYKRFSTEEIRRKLLEYWMNFRYLEEIRQLVTLSEKRVLDVGCGLTSVLEIMEGTYRVGIDPRMDFFHTVLPLNNDIQWLRAQGEYVPFKNRSFEVVFCSNALDHTIDPKATLLEIHRVLKEKGKVVLSVDVFPQKQSARDPIHRFSFSEDQVLNLLANTGFEVRFRKMSPSRAQFQKFLFGKMDQRDYRELVVVGEKGSMV